MIESVWQHCGRYMRDDEARKLGRDLGHRLGPNQ